MNKNFELEKEIGEKISISEFSGEEKEKAKLLVKIIAEVMMIDGDRDVNISGIPYKAECVQKNFSEVNEEDIKSVIDNLDRLRSEIRNKKTYLRTAIYNAVNERSLRRVKERYGTFDPEEAFKKALDRTYKKKE